MNAATEPTNGLAALRRLTWWIMIGCLAGVVLLVATELPDVPARAVVFAVLLPVCAVAGFLFAVPLAGGPPPPAAVIVAAAAGATGILTYGHVLGSGGFPWVLPLSAVLAAAHAGAHRPAPLVWPVGAGLAFAASWPVGGTTVLAALTDTGMTVLCAASLYAQIWICEVAERLDHARHAERSAAVTGERQRFAAELHDIQGHNLQVIALKSELA